MASWVKHCQAHCCSCWKLRETGALHEIQDAHDEAPQRCILPLYSNRMITRAVACSLFNYRFYDREYECKTDGLSNLIPPLSNIPPTDATVPDAMSVNSAPAQPGCWLLSSSYLFPWCLSVKLLLDLVPALPPAVPDIALMTAAGIRAWTFMLSQIPFMCNGPYTSEKENHSRYMLYMICFGTNFLFNASGFHDSTRGPLSSHTYTLKCCR